MTNHPDDFRDLAVYCHACGDPAVERFNGRYYCRECWLELAKGIVNIRPVRCYKPGRSDGPRAAEDRL